MIERVAVALALAAVVVVTVTLLRRRRPDAPSVPTAGHLPPVQVDRADFDRPDAPWLVVVFTAATCSTCEKVWQAARVLESEQVAVQQVEVGQHPELHERYGIVAVPITAIVGADGVVGNGFAGPVSATHLWGALAELREPGTIPPGCDHGEHPTGP
jgi:hypothetical protein